MCIYYQEEMRVAQGDTGENCINIGFAIAISERINTV